MRQLISGMVAAVAVMAASPAMAWCGGYSSCSPCGYSSCGTAYAAPFVSYSYGYGYGCGTGCGGWATQRLADPQQQYYYVNQGPTYTGPGSWAPVPTYSEGGSYRVQPITAIAPAIARLRAPATTATATVRIAPPIATATARALRLPPRRAVSLRPPRLRRYF